MTDSIKQLEKQVHIFFPWCRNFELSFNKTYINIVVYWRNAQDSARSTSYRIPWSGFSETAIESMVKKLNEFFRAGNMPAVMEAHNPAQSAAPAPEQLP